jgi:uroporphyrinogen-III synthase
LVNIVDGDAVARARLVCIGETTAQAVEHRGLQVSATAHRPSTEGLLEAILSVAGEMK